MDSSGRIATLKQIFASIGVNLLFNGELPNEIEKAHLFIEIIRESVTNAVRHGFATEVIIKSGKTDEMYNLTITNNGHLPYGTISEGGGISSIRKKVENGYGNLSVSSKQHFTVFVSIPIGEVLHHDKGINR